MTLIAGSPHERSDMRDRGRPAYRSAHAGYDRQTHLGILATHFARVLQIHLPSKRKGAGKTGCALHPRSHVQQQTKSAHEHTGSAETLRPSLRDGFTAYFVLSPARPELVCHRRPQEACASQELDTSHRGVRTTRLCRTLHAPFVKSASASTAPRPNVSDDGQRPLSRDGMASNKQLICLRDQA